MALVAYANSDSSDFEDDENDNASVTLNLKVEGPKDALRKSPSSQIQLNGDAVSEGQSLFNMLPSTSKRAPAIEDDDEFLHKKETVSDIKTKAKITVPSLSDVVIRPSSAKHEQVVLAACGWSPLPGNVANSIPQFRDVEDRPLTARPKASNGKKSGLLSMLPQPKNAGMSSTSLIPNVLKNKPSAPLVPTSVRKKPSASPAKKVKSEAKGLFTSYSDESDDDEETTDFFSINKPINIAPIEDPPDINMVPVKTEEMAKIEIEFKLDEGVPQHVELKSDYLQGENVSEYNNGESTSNTNDTTADTSGGNTLDDEAIRQLIGSRGKRRREEIQVVDVDQREVLGDAREWLLKGLMDDSTKRVSSSKKTGNEPSSQQRRKHQITYLAHQAKANEAELQNQWANSRMSKRKTQSKYGF